MSKTLCKRRNNGRSTWPAKMIMVTKRTITVVNLVWLIGSWGITREQGFIYGIFMAKASGFCLPSFMMVSTCFPGICPGLPLAMSLGIPQEMDVWTIPAIGYHCCCWINIHKHISINDLPICVACNGSYSHIISLLLLVYLVTDYRTLNRCQPPLITLNIRIDFFWMGLHRSGTK